MEFNLNILLLFVTYLHELGHVIGALLTGGSVSSLQVNMDGSGLATTSGGIRSVVEAAGYIGSIVFGNILLRIGIKHRDLSRYVLAGLGAFMAVSSVIWFSTFASFAFTFLCGAALVLVSRIKYKMPNLAIVILGLYSIGYIISDYDVGPTSDLNAFAGIIPAVVWMYIWLGVALIITGWNTWSMIRQKK